MIARHPGLKLIATFVAAVFFMTSLGIMPETFAATGAGAPELPFLSGKSLDIPAEFGQVTDTVIGSPSLPTFIHIQSAHGNYGAEKNIENILGSIAKNSSVSLMLLEGAASKLQPELLRIFPKHPDFNRKITDKLMQEGYITGPENFLINQKPKGTGRHLMSSSFAGFGIEDLAAYKKDREAFINVVENEKTAEKFLGSLRATIDKRFSSKLNKDLLNLVRQEEAFGSGTVSFEGWLKVLGEASRKHLKLDLSDAFYQDQYPFLIRYYRLQTIGSKINREKAMTEFQPFIKELEERKISKEIVELFRKEAGMSSPGALTSPEERAGPVLDSRFRGNDPKAIKGYSPLRHAFDEAFEKLPKDFSMKSWPDWTLYAQHLILMQEMEGKGLHEETVLLKDKIETTLAKTDDEKEYLAAVRQLYLLRRLFSLELTRSEYEELLTLSQSRQAAKSQRGGMETLYPGDLPVFQAAMTFYATAVVRENIMFVNALKRMKEQKQDRAVIVTGGFHTDGLKELAKSKGCSYLQITPRINEITKRDHEIYLKSILGTRDEKGADRQILPSPFTRDASVSQMNRLLVLAGNDLRTVTGNTYAARSSDAIYRTVDFGIHSEPVVNQPQLAYALAHSFLVTGNGAITPSATRTASGALAAKKITGPTVTAARSETRMSTDETAVHERTKEALALSSRINGLATKIDQLKTQIADLRKTSGNNTKQLRALQETLDKLKGEREQLLPLLSVALAREENAVGNRLTPGLRLADGEGLPSVSPKLTSDAGRSEARNIEPETYNLSYFLLQHADELSRMDKVLPADALSSLITSAPESVIEALNNVLFSQWQASTQATKPNVTQWIMATNLHSDYRVERNFKTITQPREDLNDVSVTHLNLRFPYIGQNEHGYYFDLLRMPAELVPARFKIQFQPVAKRNLRFLELLSEQQNNPEILLAAYSEAMAQARKRNPLRTSFAAKSKEHATLMAMADYALSTLKQQAETKKDSTAAGVKLRQTSSFAAADTGIQRIVLEEGLSSVMLGVITPFTAGSEEILARIRDDQSQITQVDLGNYSLQDEELKAVKRIQQIATRWNEMAQSLKGNVFALSVLSLRMEALLIRWQRKYSVKSKSAHHDGNVSAGQYDKQNITGGFTPKGQGISRKPDPAKRETNYKPGGHLGRTYPPDEPAKRKDRSEVRNEVTEEASSGNMGFWAYVGGLASLATGVAFGFHYFFTFGWTVSILACLITVAGVHFLVGSILIFLVGYLSAPVDRLQHETWKSPLSHPISRSSVVSIDLSVKKYLDQHVRNMLVKERLVAFWDKLKADDRVPLFQKSSLRMKYRQALDGSPIPFLAGLKHRRNGLRLRILLGSFFSGITAVAFFDKTLAFPALSTEILLAVSLYGLSGLIKNYFYSQNPYAILVKAFEETVSGSRSEARSQEILVSFSSDHGWESRVGERTFTDNSLDDFAARLQRLLGGTVEIVDETLALLKIKVKRHDRISRRLTGNGDTLTVSGVKPRELNEAIARVLAVTGPRFSQSLSWKARFTTLPFIPYLSQWSAINDALYEFGVKHGQGVEARKWVNALVNRLAINPNILYFELMGTDIPGVIRTLAPERLQDVLEEAVIMAEHDRDPAYFLQDQASLSEMGTSESNVAAANEIKAKILLANSIKRLDFGAELTWYILSRQGFEPTTIVHYSWDDNLSKDTEEKRKKQSLRIDRKDDAPSTICSSDWEILRLLGLIQKKVRSEARFAPDPDHAVAFLPLAEELFHKGVSRDQLMTFVLAPALFVPRTKATVIESILFQANFDPSNPVALQKLLNAFDAIATAVPEVVAVGESSSKGVYLGSSQYEMPRLYVFDHQGRIKIPATKLAGKVNAAAWLPQDVNIQYGNKTMLISNSQNGFRVAVPYVNDVGSLSLVKNAINLATASSGRSEARQPGTQEQTASIDLSVKTYLEQHVGNRVVRQRLVDFWDKLKKDNHVPLFEKSSLHMKYQQALEGGSPIPFLVDLKYRRDGLRLRILLGFVFSGITAAAFFQPAQDFADLSTGILSVIGLYGLSGLIKNYFYSQNPYAILVKAFEETVSGPRSEARSQEIRVDFSSAGWEINVGEQNFMEPHLDGFAARLQQLLGGSVTIADRAQAMLKIEVKQHLSLFRRILAGTKDRTLTIQVSAVKTMPLNKIISAVLAIAESSYSQSLSWKAICRTHLRSDSPWMSINPALYDYGLRYGQESNARSWVNALINRMVETNDSRYLKVMESVIPSVIRSLPPDKLRDALAEAVRRIGKGNDPSDYLREQTQRSEARNVTVENVDAFFKALSDRYQQDDFKGFGVIVFPANDQVLGAISLDGKALDDPEFFGFIQHKDHSIEYLNRYAGSSVRAGLSESKLEVSGEGEPVVLYHGPFPWLAILMKKADGGLRFVDATGRFSLNREDRDFKLGKFIPPEPWYADKVSPVRAYVELAQLTTPASEAAPSPLAAAPIIRLVGLPNVPSKAETIAGTLAVLEKPPAEVISSPLSTQQPRDTKLKLKVNAQVAATGQRAQNAPALDEGNLGPSKPKFSPWKKLFGGRSETRTVITATKEQTARITEKFGFGQMDEPQLAVESVQTTLAKAMTPALGIKVGGHFVPHLTNPGALPSAFRSEVRLSTGASIKNRITPSETPSRGILATTAHVTTGILPVLFTTAHQVYVTIARQFFPNRFRTASASRIVSDVRTMLKIQDAAGLMAELYSAGDGVTAGDLESYGALLTNSQQRVVLFWISEPKQLASNEALARKTINSLNGSAKLAGINATGRFQIYVETATKMKTAMDNAVSQNYKEMAVVTDDITSVMVLAGEEVLLNQVRAKNVRAEFIARKNYSPNSKLRGAAHLATARLSQELLINAKDLLNPRTVPILNRANGRYSLKESGLMALAATFNAALKAMRAMARAA